MKLIRGFGQSVGNLMTSSGAPDAENQQWFAAWLQGGPDSDLIRAIPTDVTDDWPSIQMTLEDLTRATLDAGLSVFGVTSDAVNAEVAAVGKVTNEALASFANAAKAAGNAADTVAQRAKDIIQAAAQAGATVAGAGAAGFTLGSFGGIALIALAAWFILKDSRR